MSACDVPVVTMEEPPWVPGAGNAAEQRKPKLRTLKRLSWIDNYALALFKTAVAATNTAWQRNQLRASRRIMAPKLISFASLPPCALPVSEALPRVDLMPLDSPQFAALAVAHLPTRSV